MVLGGMGFTWRHDGRRLGMEKGFAPWLFGIRSGVIEGRMSRIFRKAGGLRFSEAGLRELFLARGHDAGQLLEDSCRGCVACCGGAAVPQVCSYIVERHATAGVVERGKVVLTAGNALVGGLRVEDGGLVVVLFDAETIFVHHAEVVVGLGKPLRGGLAIPEERLFIVARESDAVMVEGPEVVLGDCVAVFRGFAIPRCSFSIVVGNAAAGVVDVAEFAFGEGICPGLLRLDTSGWPGSYRATLQSLSRKGRRD